MRGIDFTESMKTLDRLRRFKAYTLNLKYMQLSSDSTRGICVTEDKNDKESEMEKISSIATSTCGTEWAEIRSKSYLNSIKDEEMDGYSSWCRMNKDKIENWKSKLFKNEIVGWI